MLFRSERVDYNHIHWTCECGYKSETDFTSLTKKINPYETKFRQPILGIEDSGIISITSDEDRKLELLSLEEISRLTSVDEPLETVLSDIVESIAKRLRVEVCSIYLYTDDELLLSATWGLAPESVGNVSLGLGEGITGCAALGDSPVVVEDVSEDERYKYFSITKEEKYKGMVSCPVKDEGKLLGVLNVQTRKRRLFNSHELNYVTIVSNLIKNCLKIREKKR